MEDFMNRNSGHKEVGNLESEIFSCLRRIINAVEIYSSKLKDKTELNASQLSCLLVLEKAGPLSLSKLSQHVFLSPSMITSIVDQLEKKEFVVRARKSTDRRVILIELTNKGKEIAQTAPPSFQEQLVNSLGHLKAEEKKFLFDSLNKLLSVIVSDVLIDSSLLGGEDRLVEVESSVLKKENDI
jgi:MarR family transcriptional regulator, organic hydroperoxide resistance regulator